MPTLILQLLMTWEIKEECQIAALCEIQGLVEVEVRGLDMTMNVTRVSTTPMSTCIRMIRFSSAYGIGGVVNKSLVTQGRFYCGVN